MAPTAKKGRARVPTAPDQDTPRQSYFTRQDKHTFVSSGSVLLDCVLGGGFAVGRIANIIGDKSSGKTLLSVEAAANFRRAYPEGRIWYNETEAAFDEDYAKALGMPIESIEFERDCVTVEDVFEHLSNAIKGSTETNEPGLYIVDSLDALSDRAEMDRGISDGTYGAQKAKKLSEIFRRLTKPLFDANILLIIISQVRSNLTPAFGARATIRSGGRALDFYASQVIYLAQLKRYGRTVNKVKRPTGIQVRVKCDKNKVGLPFRECDLDIMFGYGIDDMTSCVAWLDSVGALDRVSDKGVTALMREIKSMDDDTYFDLLDKVRDVTKTVWYEIETSFLPTRRKYR